MKRKVQITTEQLDRLIADLRALPGEPVGEHLSDEEFIDYAMEALAEPEIDRLDTHLASCPECAAEMERLVDGAAVWVEKPSLVMLADEAGEKTPWWERVASWRKDITSWFGPHEPIAGDLKVLIIEVARGVVTPLAPAELPLFQATCEAFFKDLRYILKALEDQRRPAEMLAFGLETHAVSLTPAALAVATEVVQFVVEQVKESFPTESAEGVAKLVKEMLKGPPPAGEKERTAPPSLTSEQLTRVRQLAFERACRFGLPEDQARRLADALVEHPAGIGA